MNVACKIQRYLDQLHLPDCQTFVVPLMNKDSLEMTDADRQKLLETVEALLPHNAPIIVTHGTDTMVESGLHLKAGLRRVPVPIVFTGAMTPLGFEASDGLQNLTQSLFAVRLLPTGIWVVVHNRAFPIDRVRKDHEKAGFVWLDPANGPRRIY